MMFAHSMLCPTRKNPTCPGSKGPKKGGGGPSSGLGGSVKLPDFKRAEKSAPTRHGFLPEEWFVFFYPQTGVSGSYVFGIVLINYCLSKEIYVMEHEYFIGLSIATALYYITTTFGSEIGHSLDAEIKAIEDDWERGRQEDRNIYETTIKTAQETQIRANGQKLLMDAKKENIAMQLEAVYRERMMQVYTATKGRLDYQAKRHRAELKVHQKWMVEWILGNVRKAITPEFEQQALDAAIRDLSAAAEKK